MAKKTCANDDCYNHDRVNMIFCDQCLDEVIHKLTIEDLYDIYYEVDKKLEEDIEEGLDYELLTKKGQKALTRIKEKWFKIMNNLMMKKDRIKT